MDGTKILGVQQAREQLRDRIDAALEQGEHTVITRAGRPVVALVPYGWYSAMRPDALTATVKAALSADSLSTYVDEDTDVIDGMLSEVVAAVVRAVVDPKS